MKKIRRTSLFVISSMVYFYGVPVHAEGTARLWYTVEAGLEGCPDVGIFQERVAARIGYEPFSRESSLEIDVRIASESDGLRGSVTLRGDQPREFTAPEGQCDQLADAMAVAVAHSIDPNATNLQPSPPPTQAPTPPPSPAEPPAAVVESMRQSIGEADGATSGEVPVRFEAPGEELMLHQRLETFAVVSAYRRVCIAPCDTSLPLGVNLLAVSLRGRQAVEPREPVQIQGPSLITASYRSRRAVRLFVGVVSLVSLLGGIVLGSFGIARYGDDEKQGIAMMASGFSLVGVGTIALILGFRVVRDRVELEVTPHLPVIAR